MIRLIGIYCCFVLALISCGGGGGGNGFGPFADATLENLGDADFRSASYDGSVIVGGSFFGGIAHAVRWTPSVGIVSILGGEALAVDTSENGQVAVGTSWSQGGFYWTAGGVTFLDSLGDEDIVRPEGVSANGMIVAGTSEKFNDGGYTKAFRWTVGGGMVDIGSLSAGGNAVATAISADGSTIVGYAESNDGQWRAFRWTAGGGMQNLGLLSGDTESFATAVSEDGSVIAGYSRSEITEGRAFRWTASGGMQRIGSGSNRMEPYSISNDGSIIVGYESDGGPGNTFGFVWTAGNGVRYLQGFGGFTEARGISGDGKVVVGRAEYNDSVTGVRWILN